MEDTDLPGDLLTGAKAIAEYTGWPMRRVYYVAENGLVAGLFKVGKIWHGRKSKIDRGLDALEAKHAGPGV